MASATKRLLLVAIGMVLLPSVLRAEGEIKSFVDVTKEMGLKGNNGGCAAWGDYDNDGWVDVCIGGEVWHNDKGKRFTKVAKVAGPAIWGDFDNDGFLDLFCYETGKLYRNVNGKEFKEVKFP